MYQGSSGTHYPRPIEHLSGVGFLAKGSPKLWFSKVFFAFQSLLSFGNIWCGTGSLKITGAAAGLARALASPQPSALLQLKPAQQVCRAAEVQQLFCQALQLR